MQFLWMSHFSGCGGSTLGAIAAGFQPTLGFDWDEDIVQLYRQNIGLIVKHDLSAPYFREGFDPNGWKEREGNSILVLQTSPPCQEYSRANKRANKDSDRGLVLDRTWNDIELIRPEYVVLENVPGYGKSECYARFRAYLKELGYVFSEHTLDSYDFGVPQRRKRFFAIASRGGYALPAIEPPRIRLSWLDAIADLIDDLPLVPLTHHQKLLLEEYRGGYPVLIERTGYYDKPKLADWENPCWTIRASIGGDHKGANRNRFIDVVTDDARSLSVKALARLQSFPDSYQWSGITSTDVRAIGNAVPPKMMEYICQSITSLY